MQKCGKILVALRWGWSDTNEEDTEADFADVNDEGIAWLSSLEGELINIICCFFCKLLAQNPDKRLAVTSAELGWAAGLIKMLSMFHTKKTNKDVMSCQKLTLQQPTEIALN